jgi:hypothetical protein
VSIEDRYSTGGTGQGGFGDGSPGAGGGVQDKAQQAAGAAQERAQQAAGVVQDKAQQAAGQARGQLGQQVDQRSTQAGERVVTMAQDARSVSQTLREQGKEQPAKLVDQVADRAERLGAYLRDSDGDSILNDVENFGRRQPWVVMGGGLLLGLVASRFLKASSSRRYEASRRGPALQPTYSRPSYDVPTPATGYGEPARAGGFVEPAPAGGFVEPAPAGGFVEPAPAPGALPSDDPLATPPRGSSLGESR